MLMPHKRRRLGYCGTVTSLALQALMSTGQEHPALEWLPHGKLATHTDC